MRNKTKISNSDKFKRNPRKITEKQKALLADHLSELGDLSGVIYCHTAKAFVGGNQRSDIFDGAEIEITERFDTPTKHKTVAHGYILWQGEKYAYREVAFTEAEFRKACIAANNDGGEFDLEILKMDWDTDDLTDWGFEFPVLDIDLDNDLDNDLGDDDGKESDTPPDIDKAEELRKEWHTETGQLWKLGKHRLICGDCTDPDVVARLMGGEKAVLLHADPPYGMGKENDGIINDNLYNEKLDAFQLKWWAALRPHLKDNASAYIWGNAESLWRLWYIGGLRDSERLTFRNEIVWNKEHGLGMASDQHRMYPTVSERCLFFMLGEQGINTNADNYWEGWEPIRKYLAGEKEKMGWDRYKLRTIAGHSASGGSAHWTGKSQWTFPTEKVYLTWQKAAEGQAFKREYDDLKREFYSTRAYFDNTHENMTDVWQYGRVTGEDRHGHATPKPVEMIARIIKSSCPEHGLTTDPFGGSGTTLIAAQNTDRICFMSEIDPGYCAVILQRYKEHTGKDPEKT